MKYLIKVKVILADDLELFNLKMTVKVDDKASKKSIQDCVFEKLEKAGLPAKAIKIKSCISIKSQFIKTGLESEAENIESKVKVFFKFYDKRKSNVEI